jgi:hypothetical protein
MTTDFAQTLATKAATRHPIPPNLREEWEKKDLDELTRELVETRY